MIMKSFITIVNNGQTGEFYRESVIGTFSTLRKASWVGAREALGSSFRVEAYFMDSDLGRYATYHFDHHGNAI